MLAFVSISNCMYIPTPTHSLSSSCGVVPIQVIESITPGKTTREDLVLKIGGPDRLYQGERIFVYEWSGKEGVLAAGYGYSGAAATIERNHYLAIEFDQKNIVVKYKHYASGLFDSLYSRGTGAEQRMLEWVEAAEE